MFSNLCVRLCYSMGGNKDEISLFTSAPTPEVPLNVHHSLLTPFTFDYDVIVLMHK